METNFQILASKLDAIASSLQAINQTLIALQNQQPPLPIVQSKPVTAPTTLFEEPKKDVFLSAPKLMQEFPDLFKKTWDIYRLQRSNDIPYYRVGKGIKFKKSEILNWIKEKTPDELNKLLKPEHKKTFVIYSELTKIV
jgi:hypothetical protein